MNDDALDGDVREALEPDAGAIERVMRGALTPGRPPRAARARLLVTAVAITVLSVGAWLWNRDTRDRAPAPTRLTNVHDTIVVTPASGAIWLIGSRGPGDDRLPAGTIVVHRSGESR